MVAFLIFGCLSLFSSQAKAQCSIVAPANGCVNEIITFDKTNSVTYTSLNWDFGDGNSSTQVNPFYQYTTTGNFTVTLTLNLAAGGTCVATHSIDIHDLPKPDIKVSANSIFCFNENEIELEDRSKSGTSSGVMQSRLVLWGDGDRTVSTQPTMPTYVSHSYSRIDKFYLDIELVNDKGCKIKTIDSIEILPFYQPSFGIIDRLFPCDTARICLGNDSVPNPAILKSLVWDWGDGKSNSELSTVVCHIYTQSSNFPLRLIATHVNGCEADTTLNEYINIPDLDLKPSMGDLRQCVGSRFIFIHPQKSDVTYYWRVTDTAGHLIDAKVGPVFSSVFNTPGKYYVELRGNSGQCDKFYYDSFDVVGIYPTLRVLNENQCGTEDTVYFNAYLQTHGTDSFEVFWYFGDSLADICTTKVNGTNYNCKYSNQPFARHKYDTQGCYNIKFFVRDLENGCYWQDELFVTLRKITENDVSYEVKKKCTGKLADYAFRFKVPDCISDVLVNYDSACNPTLFNNLAEGKPYEYTCDDSGWVTVGFIMRNGDAKLFLSNDTTDYIIDSSKICEVHIWKHRWFRLNPSPYPWFTFNRDSCPPSNTAVTLDFPEQPKVESAFLQWGDGTSSTVYKHKDSVNFGPFLHQYAKSGMFILWVTLTTDSGCYDSYFDTIMLGHYSQIWHDPILCPGKPIELVDAIRYFDDTLFWWRVPSHRQQGIETMIWDLADGNGFSWDKPLPKVTYYTPGIYPVRLATKDKNGCRDTLVQNISVTNIVAGIKPITKKIICDDIIQLFDSSDLKKYEGLDSIKEYFWDFGDGKNPSYLKNPFHYYSSYGDFIITHSVITASGCSDTVSTSIFIGGPIPDFKIKDTIGCAPFKAEFINESKSVTKYIWYYGDAANSTYSTSLDTGVQFTYMDQTVS